MPQNIRDIRPIRALIRDKALRADPIATLQPHHKTILRIADFPINTLTGDPNVI